MLAAKSGPSCDLLRIDICLVGLEFNGPVNTIKVMSSRSVYLTTLFLGRFISKRLTSTGISHSPETDKNSRF